MCNVYKQKSTVELYETLLSNFIPLIGVKLHEYGVIMHINAHEDRVVPPQYTTLCCEVTSEEKWPRLDNAIYPGRPGVATDFPLFAPFFTLQRIEVLKSVTLSLHFF